MLNSRRALIRIKRTYVDDIVIKNGGFRDPWFAGKFSGDNKKYRASNEQKHFPTFDKVLTGIERPMSNPIYASKMKWDGTPKTSPVTSIYNPDHAGWAPKPTWLLTRSQSGLRTGSYPGAKAKDVWKPPGKGQRSVMVKSYEPEEPPLEFMELYTDVNNEYKDKMLALRMFMFRRYVEPTLVEEEAFAQLQVLIEQHRATLDALDSDEHRDTLRSLIQQYEPPRSPVRHHRFQNWYSIEEGDDGSGHGRGQTLVKQALVALVDLVEDFSIFDFADVYDMNSQVELDRILSWNKAREGDILDDMRVDLAEQEQRLDEEEEREHVKMEKLAMEKEQRTRVDFEQVIADSENFFYPENWASKTVMAMKNPVTVNFPVDESGAIDIENRKVATFEERFRLAILEKDFEQIHIMRREKELNTVAEEQTHWKKWVKEKNTEDMAQVRRLLEKEDSETASKLLDKKTAILALDE